MPDTLAARPPRVYAIADVSALGAERLAEAVVEIARSGVRWIQIRAKALADRELYRRIEECLEATTGLDCELWLDDRADLAALFPFRGLQLGQADLPPVAARRVVGPKLWIGRSTHDSEQVLTADADPAVDVVAFGPVFATASKSDPDPVVGLRSLRRARALTRKPLVAIGGIDVGNIGSVLDTGADSAAMIGAICHGDIGANCRRLLRAVAGELRND